MLSAAQRQAEARVQRFERMGGVDLRRRIDPDDRDTLARVRTGVAETGIRYRFRCPICGTVIVNDQEMTPVCTGPNWTDDHPHEEMVRVP